MSRIRRYDGDGNRVKHANGSGTIYYLWSSVLGQPVAEVTSGGVYRAYVYGPGGGQMLAQQSYDGQFYWAHTDHLGSGRKLTNTSGTVVYRGEFDPHGQSLYEWHTTGQTYLNSHKFTGYERDWATNLDHAKARTYSHNRGRFMQPDPLGLGAADATDPQSLNRYSYVQNDPVNFVDPSGMMPFLPGAEAGWGDVSSGFWGGGWNFNDRPRGSRASVSFNCVWDSVTGTRECGWEWYDDDGGGGRVGSGGQSQQNQNEPCGEPPWDQAIGPNGINNQLLNPIGVEQTWTSDGYRYAMTNPGSFSDFEDRLKANGWEKFSTDPHYQHWGDDDYRKQYNGKQYNGEWYHLSIGRPGYNLPKQGFVLTPEAPPTRFSLHWEEAKPGGGRHFLNFLGSKLFGIPIKAFHPCTPKVVGR